MINRSLPALKRLATMNPGLARWRTGSCEQFPILIPLIRVPLTAFCSYCSFDIIAEVATCAQRKHAARCKTDSDSKAVLDGKIERYYG